MTTQILIASDLTARGDRPMERARLLAEAWSADRTIIFVPPGKKADIDQKQIKQALSRNYGDDAQDCALVIAEGKAPQAIAETAERLHADLIVAGAARHNSVTDFFLGTAVDYLVRHASAPTLVVKERPRGNYRNILVATDFSEFSAQALRIALRRWPDAHVHLVHSFHAAYGAFVKSDQAASDQRAESQAEFDAFMKGMELSGEDAARVTAHLVEGDLHHTVHSMLEKGKVDLLVLGTHGRGGFFQATIGSRASEMLGWSPVDVLMVRKPAKA